MSDALTEQTHILAARSPRKPYLPSKPLPTQLRDHCNVYFQEELCMRVLAFTKQH